MPTNVVNTVYTLQYSPIAIKTVYEYKAYIILSTKIFITLGGIPYKTALLKTLLRFNRKN